MESFEKPPCYEVKFNQKVVISTLADMELCGITNVEEEFVTLILGEIALILKQQVPELKRAVDKINQEKLGVI